MTESNENRNVPENEADVNAQSAEQVREQQEAKDARTEDKKSKKHGKDGRAEELETRISELEAAAADHAEQYKRMLAEYDNFRKRTQRERESYYADAVCMTVAAFLPVLDNLERAAAAEESPEGAKLILRQYNDILEKLNVKAFGTEGEAFDPQKHNALLHADGEGGETVLAQVFKKGYAQGDRIIRHADVKTTD